MKEKSSPGVLELIHAAALCPAGWDDVLRRLASLTGCVAGGLTVERPATREGTPLTYFGFDPDHVARSFDHYLQLNPLFRIEPLMQRGFVVANGDVVALDAFRQSEFYSGWARPQGLCSPITVVIRRTADSYVPLTLVRPDGAGEATAAGRALLARLAPHLVHAMDVTVRLQAAEGMRDDARMMLEALPCGALLLDRMQRVVFANRAANKLLDPVGNGVLTCTSGRIVVRDLAADRRFQAAASIALGLNAGPKSSQFSVQGPLDAGKLTISLNPLPPLESIWSTLGDTFFGQARCMVLISSTSVTELAHQYGLTPAETRVLSAVVVGKGLTAAARELGIARSTAQSHLDKVFQKQGRTVKPNWSVWPRLDLGPDADYQGHGAAPVMKPEIKSLTGIRGVAATLVMLDHYSAIDFSYPFPLDMLPHMYLAVDMFMVLSGFILAMAYEDRLETLSPGEGYRLFLRHRIARLYPLYALTTLVCFMLCRAGWLTFLKPDKSPAALVANLVALQTWVWPGSSLDGPGWSISAEWFANLVFPLLVPLILGRSLVRATCVSGLSFAGLVLSTIAFGQLFDVPSPGAANIISGPEALGRCVSEFAIGMYCWRLRLRSPWTRALSRGRLQLVLLLILTGLMQFTALDSLFVAACALLLVGLSFDSSALSFVLQSAPLSHLGKISYSIYLTHITLLPFRDWLAGLFESHQIRGAWVCAVLCSAMAALLLATLTWRYVEKPAQGRFLLLLREHESRPARWRW